MVSATSRIDSIIEQALAIQRLLPSYVKVHGDAGSELDDLDVIDSQLDDILEALNTEKQQDLRRARAS